MAAEQSFLFDKHISPHLVNENDIFYGEFENTCTRATCKHVTKDIIMARKYEGQIAEQIIDMLHERAHSFSMMKYLTNIHHVGHDWEEGMADTLAELVLDYYYQKHGPIMIGGQEVVFDLPITSPSSYHKENALVKSVLYPLEETGEDLVAIRSFALGDKKDFFRLTLGEKRAQMLKCNFEGIPYGPESVSVDFLLAIHKGKYRSALNSDSPYLVKNKRIKKIAERDVEAQVDTPEVQEVNNRNLRYRTSGSSSRITFKRYG